jgi:hypothetical protein
MSCRDKITRSSVLVFLFIMAAALFAGGTNNAMAVPIVGNETELTVWSIDLIVRNNNLNIATTGSAELTGTDSLGRPVVVFPITGGETQSASGGASIQHEGSGVGFSRDTSVLLIDDFVIDTGTNIVSGDVTIPRPGANPIVLEDAALFSLSESRGFFLLNVNPTSSAAFTQVFGTRNFDGELFGFASVDIQTQAVPEPGTLLLLGFGLLGMLGFRRMK